MKITWLPIVDVNPKTRNQVFRCSLTNRDIPVTAILYGHDLESHYMRGVVYDPSTGDATEYFAALTTIDGLRAWYIAERRPTKIQIRMTPDGQSFVVIDR